MSGRLELQPLTFREAYRWIKEHHRHHQPPSGAKFVIGLNDGTNVVGCIVVGRPIARCNDDGWTAEVTRCCVREGVKNGCSKLYAAAWRACRAMGYRRLLTYTRIDEPGTSLAAAGWHSVGEIRGKRWNSPGRPRVDKTEIVNRLLWEVTP